MKRTSATTIVGSIAVSGVLSWTGLSFWRRAGHSLPPVPWMVVVVMLVMAIAPFAAGWPVGLVAREAKDAAERRHEGKDDAAPRRKRFVDPLRAARILILAKRSEERRV